MSKSKTKREIEVPEENLCEKCPKDIRGKCCYISTTLEDYQIILTNHPCNFLDLETNNCTIYEERRKHHPNCLSIEEMILLGTVPKECPYVRDDEGYQSRDDARHIYPEHLPERLQEEYEKQNSLDNFEEYSRRYDEAWCEICPRCHSQDIDYIWGSHLRQGLELFIYYCEHCEIKFARIRDQIKLYRKAGKHEKVGPLVNFLRAMKENPKFLEVSD